ncbi:methyl-accepting chemotaxis protein [Paraburkholderia sp. ZP32-5]|uniref:methyl-accepting chemotaxis protein n=1 Tax=Paraburkholderia sp. ZP32-5 TaxID=2883245 RepID=UPI001F3BFB05|nr:methyl-accepting chemotaxis protein [Paraburkholderia sp. ZP32-5]
MTISNRLAIALALAVSALILVGSIGLIQMNRAEQRFEHFQNNVTRAIEDLNDAILKIAENRTLVLQWTMQSDPAAKKAIGDRIDENVSSLYAAFDKYEHDGAGTTEDQSLLAAERANIVPFVKQQQLFVSAYTHGNQDAALAMLGNDGALRTAAVAMQDSVKKHLNWNVERGRQLHDENHRAYIQSLRLLIVIATSAALACGGLVLHLRRTITASLKTIQSALENARANLDLTQRVDITRMDEIGHAAHAFNDLQDHVGQVIGSVHQAAQKVRFASSEIASGNADLSSRTEKQAESLEQTSSSMIELTETVKQNTNNARKANTLATSASSLANTGNYAVMDMVQTIGQISDRSNKISEIIGVIEGIAFQTNILALNAAVEAARAGEQGRGFAVVASEVRALAQRSSTAAKEIKVLIEASVAAVQSGAIQAREAGEMMTQVKQAIQQVADTVGEISTASEEQSAGIEQLNKAIVQMDEVTQQNAALVEEAAAAARSLDEQAISLQSVVAAFKVEKECEVSEPATPVRSAPRQTFAEFTDDWQPL